MRFILCLLAVLLALSLALAAAGCASPAPAQDDTPAPPDGSGRPFDPPITVTSVKSVDATVKFYEGEDINNNTWTKTYAEELGINLEYLWVVDGGQYQQKLSTTIMSGEIPDIFVCDGQMLKLLYDSGSLADLTDVYEQYASQDTQEILTQDPLALKASSIDGRLVAIPITDSSVASAPVLWVRQDWLSALNLPEPKTMQDVLTISERFTNGDPDKNGQNDTFGLAVSKELWSTFSSLTGFFNGHHAYPGLWIERDGRMTYGSIQPEMKQALGVLQEMYKNGEIDREFGVKDSNKVAESIATGRVGMEFGVWWNPYHPLNLNQANEPDAYWQAYPIPSVDATQAKSQYATAVGGYMVVNADFAHPEALVHMVNFWCDNVVRSQDQEVRDKYLGSLNTPDIIVYKYTDFHLWEANAQVNTGSRIRDAVATRNPQGLNADEFWRYQVIVAYYDQGIKEAWVEVATNGDNGSVQILGDIAAGTGGIQSVFYGAPTPVMAEKMAALRTMEEEMVTKVIMGEPLDSFDTFVANWKQLGGDDIIAEVNAWREANP